MNERERWLNILHFEPVDKIPFDPGQGRESTFARWYKEGLPADVKGNDIVEYALSKRETLVVE